MANENGNITLYNLIHSDNDLWKSSEIAFMKAAALIKAESPLTNHHDVRLQWANQVWSNPKETVEANKLKIAMDDLLILAEKSTDDNIESVVGKLAPEGGVVIKPKIIE